MSAKDNSEMEIYFRTTYRDRERDFQGNLFSGMRQLQHTSSYGVQHMTNRGWKNLPFIVKQKQLSRGISAWH